MSTLQSQLRLSLIDQISGAAKRIQASLQGVGRSAAGVKGGGFGSAIAASADRASRNVVALQAKLVAATAAVYGLNRAAQGIVNPAAKFETVLLDIAQKADLSDTSMAQLGTRIRTIAKDIGRGANEVAGGMDVLLGMGMKDSDALGILPTITKAATAYNATIEDLSKASMAALDNLGVKVADMPRALDAMARSGKEGAFELNDQARYFASLASLGQTLKLKGVDGVAEISSALQVIRKGAGTSEEAATRLSDVFGKITSQETIKKFGKLGIDIQKNLKKAQVQAEKTGKPFSAIDFVVENLNKALNGDVGRIGEIFQDKEARLGAIALMQYHKEFQRIRQTSKDAAGEVDKDYARRSRTFATTVARFKGAAEALSIAIGERVLPTLTRFTSAFANLVNTLDGRVTVFDKIGKAIAGFLNGLGLDDINTIGDALGKLSDAIFGTTADFEAGTDRLAQIFKRFQEFGASLRSFGETIASAIAGIERFIGLDTGALTSFLGTVASYGAGLAVAATALGLVAKSMMAVGRAALFVTGITAGTGIIKTLAGLAGGSGAATATGAAAAGAATGGIATRLAGVGRFARGAGVVGAGIAAKGAIDTVAETVGKVREGTANHGLHSPAGSDGDLKLSEYRSEIAEIEGTLDRLREKSRDPITFEIANQAALRRLEELKIAAENLDAEIAAKRVQQPAAQQDSKLAAEPSPTQPPPRVWSPKPQPAPETAPAPDPVPTRAPLPPRRPPDLLPRSKPAEAEPATVKPTVDTGSLDQAKAKAGEVSEAVDGLNATVKPQVDTGSLKEALSYAQALTRELQKAGTMSAQSASRGRSDIATATANLSRSRETNNQGRSFV